MRGQLLITFDDIDGIAGGDFLDVYVNNVIQKRVYITPYKLYSCPLYVGDVVRLEFTDPSPLSNIYLDLIRRDYTTDDIDSNMGIIDTNIALDVPFNTYTFTATTVNSAYDFEYVIETSIKTPCFTLGSGFDNNVENFIVQSDKKIIVAGAFTTYQGITNNQIVRLNFDGSIDNTFSTGTGFNNFIKIIALQTDGKLLAIGQFTTYQGTLLQRIARLNTNGSRDTTFNTFSTSFYVNGITDVKIQTNGRILISGVGGVSESFRGIRRLFSNGIVDNTFLLNGFTVNPNIVDYILILSDGKILIATSSPSYGLFRLNTNGSKDTTFTDGIMNGFIEEIAVQSDGKILIGGSFTTHNSVTKNRLLRLNSDGTVDNTFDIGTGFNLSVTSIFVQSDGKIIVGGTFTLYEGITKTRIIRLNSNGSIDNTFNAETGFNNTVRDIIVQSNSLIYVGGLFTTYKGITSNRIIRLNMDGTTNTCVV